MDSTQSKPLVSVILPTYNRSDFLRQAVASVAAQTYRPIQLVVVDDGSTEPIELVVREFEPGPGLEIVYIRQENAGVGSARNRGLASARGEWVAFLDSDDCWQPGMLADALQELHCGPSADIVVCSWNIIDENDVQTVEFNDPVRLWGSEPKNLLRQLALGNLYPIHSAVLRLDMIRLVQGFRADMLAFEDWDLWVRLAAQGAETRFTRHPGASWRVYRGERRSNLSLASFETALRQVFSHLLSDPATGRLLQEFGDHIYAWQILVRIKNPKVFPQEDLAEWVKRSEQLYRSAPKNPEMSIKYLNILATLDNDGIYYKLVQQDLPASMLQEWLYRRDLRSWRLARKSRNWARIILSGSKLAIIYPIQVIRALSSRQS